MIIMMCMYICRAPLRRFNDVVILSPYRGDSIHILTILLAKLTPGSLLELFLSESNLNI